MAGARSIALYYCPAFAENTAAQVVNVHRVQPGNADNKTGKRMLNAPCGANHCIHFELVLLDVSHPVLSIPSIKCQKLTHKSQFSTYPEATRACGGHMERNPLAEILLRRTTYGG